MPRLYQLETDFRYVNCGMCYVLELDSGEAVILDSGYFSPGQAEALHAFLEEICSNGIKIRAWLFSHAHQDHIGAFINFVRLYPDTKIEGLYFAFQPCDFSAVSGDWRESDLNTFNEFYVALSELAPKPPVHSLKTGETFTFDEASFKVLYTYSDAEEEITNFNDNSAVLMLSCKGTRVLFPGDAAAVAARFLMKKPQELKCDMVQVSHHGFFGLPMCVYQAADAHTALWPTASYEIENNAARDSNAWLFKNADCVFSSGGTAVFELPYTPGSYKRLKRVFPDRE